MPKKPQTVYVCANCDAQFSKWSGRCLECGSWGTLQKQVVDTMTERLAGYNVNPAKVIDPASLDDRKVLRHKTDIGEIDRVLGGGIMPGSLILLAGEPGIGKSTVVAQIANAVNPQTVYYVSGEESVEQIKSRFDRLNIKNNPNIRLIAETNIESILASIKQKNPSLIIIDSIQSIYTAAVPSEPGSLNQIRSAAVKLLETAKEKGIAIIMIGHITKDGAVAGPKSLEHIVDTVIYLENEPAHDYRILRATKNRFGSTNEIGIFEMTSEGFNEIVNPSLVFIENEGEAITGSVISSIMEGSRPFLVEIQALVSKTVFGYPQRKAAGFDANRLQILAAVLTKRTKINLSNQDIILNIVGGLKVSDPAQDLAVCLAIVSSLLNQSLDRKTIVLGEIGLSGEVRRINKIEQRLKEAEKLGFARAILPAQGVKMKTMKLTEVKSLNDIVNLITK